jgi:N-acetylglucosamine kinase-like BadF-type ATPase
VGAVTVGAVLAIDAGNSKTDVLLVSADGTVAGAARGEGFRPHRLGPTAAVSALAPLVQEATGGTQAEHVSACLANADLDIELERIQEAFEATGWARSTTVVNDTFGLLRAGMDSPPGVAVVCGAGINCCGLAADGRTARFAAVGRISGDWGGGGYLGEEAMWWGSRAVDGRGPDTVLAQLLPEHFGVADMAALVQAFHLGELHHARLHEAAPLLFDAAAGGDQVAVGVVLRQAEEIVALAFSALRRLDLLDEPVDVVLGGGVLAARHALLLDEVDARLAAVAPKAVTKVVTTPPVVGAGLLGLDHLGAPAEAHTRLRETYA